MDKIGTKLQYDLYAASLALQTHFNMHNYQLVFKLQICAEVI